jgi:hypothetical protein
MNEVTVVNRQTLIAGSPAKKFHRLLSVETFRRESEPRLAMALGGHTLQPLLGFHLVSETCSAQFLIDTAENWLDKLASLAELNRAVEIFDAACSETCSRDAMLMLAGILVDGFPNAKPSNMEGYVVALATVIWQNEQKFSHHIIAAAIVELWSNSVFAPSPGELLRAAERAYARFAWALRRARHLVAMRESAEALVEASTKITGIEKGE